MPLTNRFEDNLILNYNTTWVSNSASLGGMNPYELRIKSGLLKVVTDRKVPFTVDGVLVYSADVISYSDYSPYGVELDGRHGSSGYRYEFQGYSLSRFFFGKKEDEEKGGGNSYTTEFRFLVPMNNRINDMINKTLNLVCTVGLSLIFSMNIFAQKDIYTPIKTLDGKALVRVDSLSFSTEHLSSEYYVDSITQKPYTGKAIVYFGNKGYDSLTISNGVKNGWQKLYRSKKGQEYELIDLDFYNQKNRLNVSYPVKSESGNKSAFARYYIDTVYFFYQVIYKPSGKIIVKQTIHKRNRKIKKRIKMKSLEQLDCFFSLHESIYQYCKQAGFFGESEIR